MSNGDSGIRVLEINVEDKDINWTLYRGEMKGLGEKITRGKERIDLHPQSIRSTELLVTMLQLLTDLSRERPLDLADPEKDTLGIVGTIDDLFRVLGGQLFQLLFKGEIRTTLASLLDDPVVEVIRIQLEFDGEYGAQLSSWPWEYLYIPPDENDPEADSFLALKTQLMLNRVLTLKTLQFPKLESPPPFRVLLVVPSPNPQSHLTPVHGDKVIEAINEINAKSKENIFQLETLLTPPHEFDDHYHAQVTWEAFKNILEKKRKEKKPLPNIIHFIGHGRRKYEKGRGELAFLHSNGDVDWIADEDFARVVSQGDDVKLVFLQACESALPDPYISISGVAQEVARRRIPAVVAMQYKIEEEVANTFATHFYQTLAQGEPVDLAVKAGRKAIGDMRQEYAQHRAFGLPVSYLRSFGGLVEEIKSQKDQTRVIDTKPPPEELKPRPRTCPRCGKDMESFVCTNCGFKLFCLNCKNRDKRLTSLKKEEKFCGECGHTINHPSWSGEVEPPHPAEELFKVPMAETPTEAKETPPPDPDLQSVVEKRRPRSRPAEDSGGETP